MPVSSLLKERVSSPLEAFREMFLEVFETAVSTRSPNRESLVFVPINGLQLARTYGDLARSRNCIDEQTRILDSMLSLIVEHDDFDLYRALIGYVSKSLMLTDLFGKHGLEWLHKLDLPPTDRTLLEVNLEQVASLNHSIDRLTETIAGSAITNPEVKLLMGFTGIDYYSAMLLINEIGPIARFPSPKKLVSYAGLAPSTHQSGNHTTHGPITKEGNSHIRWILVEAAQHASRHDPRLSQFYMRIMKRRGHNRALVAVARKMLVTIYHVLNHHHEYRGLRPELFENKIRRLERITNSSLQTA